MNKKNAIWLFAGGPMQEIVCRKIHELTYKLILSDVDANCFCAKYADEFVPCSTFDIKANLEAGDQLRKKYDIKAVFTAGADCHETVAHLAKFLNIHGNNPKISNICRDKIKTRQVLTKAGIPQPKFGKADNVEQARAIAQKIGLPVVIKATDNSGSRGFSKIERLDDLKQEVFKRALGAGSTGYVIVEQLLKPIENEIAEQSVETVWYDGKMFWLNWVDRLFRKDFLLFKSLKDKDIYSDISWSVELGHINPAAHNYKITKQVQDLVYKAGKAVGLDKEKGGHILKIDTMLTKQGPYILELTLRLSGGWDSSKTTPERGADFIGGAVKMALAEKLDSGLFTKYFKYKNPNLFSSVLTQIPEQAKDCLGRKFSQGSSFDREESIKNAYNNLIKGRYL